jgi:hypothetical protein
MVHLRIAARVLLIRLSLFSRLRTQALSELLAQLTPPAGTASGITPTYVFNAMAWIERLVGRTRIIPNTCLYRSLARYAVLRGEGIAVQFVMGVRPDGNELIGHAWLEYQGKPLGEAVDPRLVVTYVYPTLEHTGCNREAA